ncbi:Apoptosis-antagonizing transcription factor C-terminal [Schistosoma japonicum]|nr:Apoptosis-antagonizing transcription factor C-terminal [Schistosoma japonicum]
MSYLMDEEVSSDESIECKDVEVDYKSLSNTTAISSAYTSLTQKNSSKKPKNPTYLHMSKGKVLNYLRIPKAVDFMSPDPTEYVTQTQRAALIAQLKANKD